MSATQLGVYNRALMLMGGRMLATIGEDREPKRVFDAVWTDLMQYCLEQAIWVFALRTAAAAGTSLPATLHFGFSQAFTRPSDCIFTYALSTSVSFAPPLQDVLEVDGVYLARATPLYVRYTSNNGSFGTSLTRWTNSFAEYVAHYLAATTCYRLTRNLDLAEKLFARSEMLLAQARLKDAVIASFGPLQYNERIRREFVLGDNPLEPHPFATSTSSEGGS